MNETNKAWDLFLAPAQPGLVTSAESPLPLVFPFVKG